MMSQFLLFTSYYFLQMLVCLYLTIFYFTFSILTLFGDFGALNPGSLNAGSMKVNSMPRRQLIVLPRL